MIATLSRENTELKETNRLQGEQIHDHEQQLAALTTRMNTRENFETTYATRTAALETAAKSNPLANTELSSIVRSEVSERAEMDKLKMNLVISGIAELVPNNDNADKEAVTTLLEEELNITLDLSSTERIGNSTDQTRLLRLKFATQRSRKEVLSKAVQLRNSATDHTKNNVYVRPDLTRKQQLESKNLRDLLRKTRADNPGQTYKISKNKIECTSPAEEAAEEETTDT